MIGIGLGVFETPLFLVVAILGPIIVIALVISRQQRRRARLARLGPPAIVNRLVPTASRESGLLRIMLLGGAALCAGIALAGPRWGSEQRLEHGAGVDVVLALDASLSMMARDERPNRLERMKEEVRRLRDLSPGDRTALVAFAGRSYVLTPLTVDDGALDLFLENLDPSVVGQPGTALARAIRQGTDLLVSTRTASDRALVIMSDGEGFDDESDLRAAAQAAKESGVSIVTVGFGTEAGTTIPVTGGAPGDTVKRDENGDVVVTHYTPHLLEIIADAGHGVFISATETDKAVKIRNALNKLRTQERALERGESLAPQFQLFLAPAVLLLLLDTLLADRTRVRVRKAGAVAVTAVALGFVQGPSDSAPPPQTYKQLVDKGDHTARTMYNYGTSLLASDSMDAAVSALSLVASDRDPEVRYRALFNLGLAHLKRGLAASGENAKSELDMALAAYKRVLLMRSSDSDAKWNYELALQAKQSGGGGGSSQQQKNNQQQQNGRQPQRPSDQPEGQLGKRQAEEILKSAAREERDVEGKRQKEAATDVPPIGKDW
jgi:Ca-activated chloride channel family protein